MKTQKFDDLCFDVWNAIEWGIFKGKLPYIQIEATADHLPQEYSDQLTGAFLENEPFNKLLINEEYLSKRPLDDLIITVFHELIHFYCYVHHIKDAENRSGDTYHNEAFKAAVEKFGGCCPSKDSLFGWTDIELPADTMRKIKDRLKP